MVKLTCLRLFPRNIRALRPSLWLHRGAGGGRASPSLAGTVLRHFLVVFSFPFSFRHYCSRLIFHVHQTILMIVFPEIFYLSASMYRQTPFHDYLPPQENHYNPSTSFPEGLEDSKRVGMYMSLCSSTPRHAGAGLVPADARACPLNCIPVAHSEPCTLM